MKNTVLCLYWTGLFLAIYPVASSAQYFEPGNYKDWNYSQSTVWGLIKLDNTNKRSYYKISKPDVSTTRIQGYNASGIVTSTEVIRLVNGKLNTITTTDRWGDTYEIIKFTATIPGEFMVTRRNAGKNDFFPCKGAKYIYKNNMLAELRYISYDNQLCNSSSDVSIIKYKRYDDKNRFSLVKEMSFYSAEGKPVISRSYDCHKVVYEYSERGNQQSVAYYGTDNEPLTNRFGGFKNRYVYDENDRLMKSETIGLNDEPVNNAYGVAKVEYEYSNGLKTKEIRFNDRNSITRAAASGDGIAIIKYEYDERGNEVKRTYFDEGNNPMNNHSGYQMINYRYEPNNMLADLAYFDKTGAAVGNAYGIHRYSYVRDAKNRITGVAFFDKANLPVQDESDEVYMRKYRYDEYGREVSCSYWKDTETKMNRWDGYHEQNRKYTQDGQLVEVIYLDDKGNLFKGSSGYSRLVLTYNAMAQMAERKCFDGAIPVVTTKTLVDGYHSIRYFYDEKKRVSSLKYFGPGGEPVEALITLGDDCSAHRIEFVYQGNRIVEERFYKLNDNTPFKVLDCLQNDYITASGFNKGAKNR